MPPPSTTSVPEPPELNPPAPGRYARRVDLPPIPWSSTDYRLDWPPRLLATELAALREIYPPMNPGEMVELLELACHGPIPAGRFRELAGPIVVSSGGRWQDLNRAWAWIESALIQSENMREHVEPPPLWRARQRGDTRPTASDLRVRFAELIWQLDRHGYFGRDTCRDCDEQNPDDDPRPTLRQAIEQRLQQPDVWTLQPDGTVAITWDQDTLYELIEAFHDLAARPRRVWWDNSDLCPGHYHEFDTDSGRRIYRTLINRLLHDCTIALRLADVGEDEGRLVTIVDDARSDLIDRALVTPEPGVRGRIEHAIALFRGREATEHHKRSAVITLAGILEERRTLIRGDLGRKDEGALFALANEFAIRHQRRGQHGDYDPAFLDWVFWWYLATIELTDRLLARQAPAAAGT